MALEFCFILVWITFAYSAFCTNSPPKYALLSVYNCVKHSRGRWRRYKEKSD